MDRWGPWVLLWIGYGYLMLYGDLFENDLLPRSNFDVWWEVAFGVALITAIVAGVTDSRKANTLHLAMLIPISLYRSAVYFANDFRGPLGVWLVLLGYAILVWQHVPGESRPARR